MHTFCIVPLKLAFLLTIFFFSCFDLFKHGLSNKSYQLKVEKRVLYTAWKT